MTLATSAPVPFIEQYERFLAASATREQVLVNFYAQARAELNAFLLDPPVPLTASEQAFFGSLNTEVKRLSAQALTSATAWADNIPASFVEGALQHSPGMAFNIIHDNATRALSGYTLNLITQMSADMQRVVQQQIGVGLLTGATRETVSQRILASGLTNIPHWRSVEARAEAIARTELMRAYNAGNLAGIADTGAVAVRWITGQDERVCPICGPRQGKVFRAPGVVTDDPQVLALPTVDVPPAHVKCRCTVRAFYGDMPGTATKPTPRPGGMIDEQPTPAGHAASLSELQEQLRERFGIQEIEGFDLDTGNHLARHMETLKARLPGVADWRLRRIRLTDRAGGATHVIESDASGTPLAWEIELPKSYLKGDDWLRSTGLDSPKDYLTGNVPTQRLEQWGVFDATEPRWIDDALRTKFEKATSSQAIEDIFTHELGHVLAYPEYGDWQAVRKAWDTFVDSEQGLFSAYAATSFSEALPEAFVEYLHGAYRPGMLPPGDVENLFLDMMLRLTTPLA